MQSVRSLKKCSLSTFSKIGAQGHINSTSRQNVTKKGHKTKSKTMGSPTKRMQIEVAEMEKLSAEENKNTNITMMENNLTHLKGYISGPPKTPYEGGHYYLDIVIPN